MIFETEVRFGGELGDGRDNLDPIGELQGIYPPAQGNTGAKKKSCESRRISNQPKLPATRREQNC